MTHNQIIRVRLCDDTVRFVHHHTEKVFLDPMTATPYRVLARKYRPQNLSELLGQDILVQSLRKGLAENRLPHAFILHGIRGVGKTTTARIIAKSLNCLGAGGKGKTTTADPCGVCKSCIGIVEDRHLDVMEFDAASRTGVDDIREIIDSVRYKPVMGRYKIFIIDEVHMLSKSAFNALLKTLEEPPAHVKFIFATTEIRKIPDTILSRCMRFDLKRMDVALLMTHLGDIAQREGFTIDQEALSYLARAADGSMRDGLSILDQAIALTSSDNQTHIEKSRVRDMLGLADRSRLFDLIESLFQGNVNESLKTIKILFDAGSDPILLMQDVMDLLYFVISLKVAPQLAQDPTWPEQDRLQAKTLGDKLSHAQLMQSWQVLIKGYEEIQKTPLQHQAFEMVMVRLCFMADMPTLDEILLNRGQGLPFGNTATSSALIDTDISKKKILTPAEATPNIKPSTSHPITSLITPAALIACIKDFAPLLASQIQHDIEFIDISPPLLKLHVQPQADPTITQQLGAALQKATQTTWRIERVASKGDGSLNQQSENLKKQQNQEAINHPIIQDILAQIPGTTVHVK